MEKAIKNHIKLIHHYFLRYFSVLISYFARIVFLRRCFRSLPTISYMFSCIFIVILFFTSMNWTLFNIKMLNFSLRIPGYTRQHPFKAKQKGSIAIAIKHDNFSWYWLLLLLFCAIIPNTLCYHCLSVVFEDKGKP